MLQSAHSVMAEIAHLPGAAIREAGGFGAALPADPRHLWLNTALVVSGFAIILAHPRFYWDETVGTPSLFDLAQPVPEHRLSPLGQEWSGSPTAFLETRVLTSLTGIFLIFPEIR